MKKHSLHFSFALICLIYSSCVSKKDQFYDQNVEVESIGVENIVVTKGGAIGNDKIIFKGANNTVIIESIDSYLKDDKKQDSLFFSLNGTFWSEPRSMQKEGGEVPRKVRVMVYFSVEKNT